MANLSNINNKFIVTDGGNGRVLIGATNDIGATLFANHPSTTAPSLTFNAPAGQVFENEDLQIAFGLNNASPYNGYMQTRFVSAPYYRNLAINPLGGNVGIGTNSPAYKLQVSSTTFIEGTFGNPNTDAAYRLKFYDNGGVHNDPGIGLDGSSGGGEKIWFNAYDGFYWNLGTQGIKMTLTGTGRLGIGTDLPGYKLDVESDTDSLAGAYIQAGKSSQGEIQNTGLIIGSRTDTATGDYIGVSFSGNATVPARGRAAIGAVSINGASGMDLVFMTRNAGDGSQLGTGDEKMRIKSNGIVYMGYVDATAIGGHKLEVNGALYASGNIRTNGIFSNNSAPDDDVFEAIQSGRKNSLKTYFSSGSTESQWVLKTSTGATDGSTVDALTVKPNYAIFNGGITFNGDTAATNQLDDYEEGAWTPTISHNNGTGAIPLTVTGGASYVKVGKIVHVRAYLTAVNPNGNAGGSGAYYAIRSLPFTASADGAWEVVYASAQMNSYGGYWSGNNLYFMHNGTNGQRSAVHVNGTQFNAFGANASFMFQAVYTTT